MIFGALLQMGREFWRSVAAGSVLSLKSVPACKGAELLFACFRAHGPESALSNRSIPTLINFC